MSGFDLDRFVAAQAPVYAAALAELTAGDKRTHWMWFVFPQLAALGRSDRAKFYGLAGLDEARAYLGHALLGARLIACTSAVLAVDGRSAHAIFGDTDGLKFRSSMTLFGRAAPAEPLFGQALGKYFAGAEDPATLALLGPS
ncbi:MAG: DUF1810 domain-containing protein [Devosia sp.]